MAYYLKDLPFTEEGKKLKLSDEDRERFRLVYKREGDGWVLHDIYEKGGEYGDDCIVVPLQSTYRGYDTWYASTEFANLKGSTGDQVPMGLGTWIHLWRCVYMITYQRNPPNICCTDGWVYKDNFPTEWFHQDGAIYGEHQLCGGHVIPGQNSIYQVSGAEVYIVPICASHNGIRDNGYMRIGRESTMAVRLSYKINRYNNYLAQHPLETHEKI